MRISFVLGVGAAVTLLGGCSTPDRPTPTDTQPWESVRAAGPPVSSVDAAPVGVLAVAILAPASGSEVRGFVNFVRDEKADRIRVEAEVTGLSPGKHGFHIHEKGDCTAPDASSAGGHFNPTQMPHAGPEQSSRHVGDFGNLEADASGAAHYSRTFDLKVQGYTSILGKAVIIHENSDDLATQPSGNAGGRVACGVIESRVKEGVGR